ncbi:MAG: hypothetical protein FWC36_00485 [Spirochaetes bacterium]|nr:hypothetical protein [Spirochaetota bacterium]
MKKVKIALFHYNFLPGGVTTVAANAVNAIVKYAFLNSFVVEEIVFVSGRKERPENVVQADSVIRYDFDNAIDFLPDSRYNKEDVEEKIALLLKKYDGFIWWVHNYHLGKNPVFTRVVVEYLQKNNHQNAILQIHDFPECTRPDNYRSFAGKKQIIYPIESNVRYVVINARDERYLKEAGIPGNLVWLLYDPVVGLSKKEIIQSAAKDMLMQPDAYAGAGADPLAKKIYKEKLAEQFKDFFPALDSEIPFALYPVRTIRRKNILEAALLAKVTGQGFNLIVTLPGISSQEKKYSNTVRECFERGYIPGIWASGSNICGKAVPLENVINASDFVISSSIMEGFGYHMIDSLMWNKPVITKYLDIQDGFGDLFKNSASFFYDFVVVPVKQKEREKIKQLYFDSIRRYSKIMESHNIETALDQMDSILNRDFVDFSYLPVYLQVEILVKISKDKAYKKEIKALNSALTEKILKTIKTKQSFDPLKVADYFSFTSFAAMFFKIINSFENSLPVKKPEEDGEDWVSRNMLTLFFRPEFLRLLLSEK